MDLSLLSGSGFSILSPSAAWNTTRGWVERNPLKFLILLGVLTEVLYLVFFTLPYLLPDPQHYGWLADVVKLSENKVGASIAFVMSIVALFALYYWGWRVCRRLPGNRATLTIFIFAGLFSITLVFMYPITAIDMFNYFFSARIFTHYHQNPLVVAPYQVPDPLGWTALCFWWVPSPYGPLWILLSSVPSLLGGDNLLLSLILHKVEMAVFFLLCALLIYMILSRVRPQHRNGGLFLFSWSPLLLYEAVGNGHNDIAMMFFVILGVYAFVRGKPGMGFAAIVGSVFIKYTSALIVPFFLLLWLRRTTGVRQKAFVLYVAALIAASIALVLYAPFWSPVEIANSVFSQADRWVGSVPAITKMALEQELGLGYSATLVQWLIVACFGTFYVRQLVKTGKTLEDTLTTSFETLFYFLLLASMVFYPWYLIWPFALVPLVVKRGAAQRMITFSLTALLGYFIWYFLWYWIVQGDWWGWAAMSLDDFPSFYLRIGLIAVPFTVVPPLLYSIWAWWARRRAAHAQLP